MHGKSFWETKSKAPSTWKFLRTIQTNTRRTKKILKNGSKSSKRIKRWYLLQTTTWWEAKDCQYWGSIWLWRSAKVFGENFSKRRQHLLKSNCQHLGSKNFWDWTLLWHTINWIASWSITLTTASFSQNSPNLNTLQSTSQLLWDWVP